MVQVDVEPLHTFEFVTHLGLTDIDEVYRAQAGSRKQCVMVGKRPIEQYFSEYRAPDARLGEVCK